MKFKRILAVVLSALMLTSMTSFTVSAQNVELMADPVVAFITATNQGKLTQNERGKTSIGYDAENDIVYTRVVPDFDRKSGCDNSIYINMYGLSTEVKADVDKLYAVCYMRSNQSTTNATAGFYGGFGAITGVAAGVQGSAGAYDGNEVWTKQTFEMSVSEAHQEAGRSSNHFWIRPIGSNEVHTTVVEGKDENGKDIIVVTGNKMAADAYYDVAGVALFKDKASADAYDIKALSTGKITITFDANNGEENSTVSSYDVVAGKYAASTVTFPEGIGEFTAPAGKTFVGWAASTTGGAIDDLTAVATPDVDTTYYAVYNYVDDPNVTYDEIYLQNVYTKLLNDKELTIGYLGGSVTVGSGAENQGPNSTVAWRALTTKWFKESFPEATIKEVYGGIGGTGSRFGSYRMTRDLDLANNKLDLLFVDSCVNDQYEGFTYANVADLQGNDAVIVAKALKNNPKCQIIFVNVPNNGTILSEGDSGAVQAHREFADANGFAFVDFKVAMARELMGNDTALSATKAVVDEKWSSYYADSVHPSAAGYQVYFEYLRDTLLKDLVDETLTVAKTKYENTVPVVLDINTVDTDRYISGTAGSNSADGLNTIKNYALGQMNGFMGGNRISATKEGYSTTFKFTGKNALIWSNKYVQNALLDVYLNDNTTIGSPDYTIDMWRNQNPASDGQNYLFTVLPEDLDTAAETTVTLVLRKNVDTATRQEQLSQLNPPQTAQDVGDALKNTIRSIAIKGGTMDSVEFLEAPEAFKKTVEYSDVVVSGMSGIGLKIKGTNVNGAVDFAATEYDGKSVVKAVYNGNGENGLFATDGYNIWKFGSVMGEYYNFATVYMYVDDPENKTAGIKPTMLLREDEKFKGPNNIFEADTGIVPNAWQRISIDISALETDNDLTTWSTPLDDVEQFHMRYLGENGKAKDFSDVTIYTEKVVFSAEDPGDYVDPQPRVTRILLDGVVFEDHATNTYEHSIELPYGTTEFPVVTAKGNGFATNGVEVEQNGNVATVTLKGATEADDVVYTITFTVFDGIRLNGITAAGEAIVLEDGVTEYTVNLPAGTTEVPVIAADYEGDPSKIVIAQADSLDGTATVTLTDGEDVTVYTISFFVMPDFTQVYPGAEIVYVSQNGAGEKTGADAENAYAGLNAAYEAKKSNTVKTVFVLVDDVTHDDNGDKIVPADMVITSAGGDLYVTNHIQFATSSKATITYENLKVYHTNKNDVNGEVYLVSKGNNIIFNNVHFIPYGKVGETPRTALFFVQPGGDGGTISGLTKPVHVELNDSTGIQVRGGGYGGTKMDNGINYIVGGNSEVDYIQASGHAMNASLEDINKTINGNISIIVKDNAKLNKVSAGNASITNGDMYYDFRGGEIGKLILGAENSKGNVTGAVIAYLTGAKVGEIAQGNLNADKARTIIINTDKSDVPATIAGATHTVKYSGNGEVTATTYNVAADGEIVLTLASETAQWAKVTINGVTKEYDMSTDSEVELMSEDMTINAAAGETVISFHEGTGVTFKQLAADNASEDKTMSVTGYPGTALVAPFTPTPVNNHFEFVGWAVEGTTDLVTLGTYTGESVTYVAVFKEAPAIQFKATVEGGALEAYEGEPIYGITGETIDASLIPAAPAAGAHYTFSGWVLEGTTEPIVDVTTAVFGEQKQVFVAKYDEDPYAIFKATVEQGALEALDEKVYGVLGEAIVAPQFATKNEHFKLKGWALEGTTEIVQLGVYGDVDNTYVAIIEEDPKTTITIMDGGQKVDEVTDYAGFTYTFKKLDNTIDSRFLGYATTENATEPAAFAGDEITVDVSATLYAVRQAVQPEDAEYTFSGEYDFSEGKYVIKMNYEGPKANMTAFGIAYPAEYTNFTVDYSDKVQSTGTNIKIGNGYYVDVLYPTAGATFGADNKDPVLIAEITVDMTPEQYSELDKDTFVKFTNDVEITGAYKNGEWQYIKNSDDFSLDVASHVYPIYFTDLVDDKEVTVTVNGVIPEITTSVEAPAKGTMLTEITFTAVTAENEEPALVTYYVDGIAQGELAAGADGKTYTIPAEKVYGDVVIEFSYGEPILEVTITGIEVPEVYGTPDTEAAAGHDTYTIDGIVWEPADAEFGFDTAYTVKVTITADEDYAFSGRTVYTIDGLTPVVKRIDSDTVELSYTYPATVKELGTLTVEAGLVRAENKAAHTNFGTITVKKGTEVVATYTEEAVAGNKLAASFELVAGTYTVEIAKNGYLTAAYDAEIVYQETTEIELSLIAGNLYGDGGEDDGVIDNFDFRRVLIAFTSANEITDVSALEAYRKIVDIDEDGIVTVYDLAYVKANFGTQYTE